MKTLAFLLIVVGSFAFSGQAHATTTCHLTITATTASLAGNCPQGAQVATYTYRDGAPPNNFATSLPQTRFDVGNPARLPECAWQADAFVGTAPKTIDATHDFAGGFIAGAHGGTEACQPQATTSTTTTAPASSTTVPPGSSVPSPPTSPSIPPTSSNACSPSPSAPTCTPPSCCIGSAISVERSTELPRTGFDYRAFAIGVGLVVGGLVFVAASKSTR